MSETLKGGGENSAEGVGISHLEVLTEMSGGFDPVQAKESAEQEKPINTEKLDPEHSKSVNDARLEVLAALPEKQEKELSPQDAANEYLSLLDELSQDFTNPQYTDGGSPTSIGSGGLAREIGLKYSDDPHYRRRGYAGTEAGASDRTMYRIGMADFILGSEADWRSISDSEAKTIKENNEQVAKEVADLDAKYAQKGRLGKFFGKKKYEETRREINTRLRRLPGGDENTNIAKGLAYIYDETGRKSFADMTHYQMIDNEALNRRFFGLDDPERAAKVERAIELRQKYADQWEQDTPPARQSSEQQRANSPNNANEFDSGNVDNSGEEMRNYEDVNVPEFLTEIDDQRRREIIDVSANLSEKIPDSMIMGGNALRVLYEARTGQKMFGVGKNDHDIYVPVAEAHQFMGGELPDGYVVKHELDEQGKEKWVHPERDYVVISEMGSDGRPHEHIDVFGKDDQESTTVELDGKTIRVQSLTSQIADKIDMYIETDRFNNVDEDPTHGPTTRDKNGVYAQRMLELVDAAPDEVDESKLPENWRDILTAIAAEGEYGVQPDETPEEKAARERGIQEKIELKNRREQAKNEFIEALSLYFAENHDSTDAAELSPELAGPLAGYEEVVNDKLKTTGTAEDFMQGIIAAIGPDATKEVVNRVTKDII